MNAVIVVLVVLPAVNGQVELPKQLVVLFVNVSVIAPKNV